MKKVIFAAVAAIVFSAAMGAANALEYKSTVKKVARTEACNCNDCSCTNCACTDCSKGSCDEGCCDNGSGCSAK